MESTATATGNTINLTTNFNQSWTLPSSTTLKTIITTSSTDFTSSITAETETPTTTVPGDKDFIIAISAVIAAFFTGIAITLICICLYIKIIKPKRAERNNNNHKQSTPSKQSLYKPNNNGTLNSNYEPYAVTTLSVDMDIITKDDGYVDMKGKPPTMAPNGNPDYINTMTNPTTARPPLQKKDSSSSQAYESMDMPYYNIDKNDKFYIEVLPENDTGDNDSIYEQYDKNKENSNDKENKANVSNDKECKSKELLDNNKPNQSVLLPNKLAPKVPKKPNKNKNGKVIDSEKDKLNANKTRPMQETQFQVKLNRELNNKLGKMKAKNTDEKESIPIENNAYFKQAQEEIFYVNVDT